MTKDLATSRRSASRASGAAACRRPRCRSRGSATPPCPGWSSVVWTSTTFEPPSASCLIGANRRLRVGQRDEHRVGLLGGTALTIGVCWAGSNCPGASKFEGRRASSPLPGPRRILVIWNWSPLTPAMSVHVVLLAAARAGARAGAQTDEEEPLSLPPHAARTSAADEKAGRRTLAGVKGDRHFSSREPGAGQRRSSASA